MKFFTNIKATYLFNVVGVLLVIIAIIINLEFSSAKYNIENTYLKENLKYIDDFGLNFKNILLESVSKDIYLELQHNNELRDKLENTLSLWVTDRYKYIYLLYYEDNNNDQYRFVLDGSKVLEDKSDFGELYFPLEADKFNQMLATKKSISFTHENIDSLWRTHLNPIVIDEKVKYVLVVDFSMAEYKKIDNVLDNLYNIFNYLAIFIVFIFIVIVWFSIVDYKREKEKTKIYLSIKNKSIELEDKVHEINILNETLEIKVKEEVSKSKYKDQQLIEQSRLAQMGEMISMIAHQWRQPLSAISSTAASLNVKAQLGSSDIDDILESTGKISEYTQHLSITIDDFREFFKPNKELTKTSICDLIGSVLAIIGTSLSNKSINITKDLTSVSQFFTYQNELKQVILNIMKNAEDALEENNLENPTINITSRDENDKIILTIRDNGGGIKDQDSKKIFDPYFSTKKQKNGTGLGLYMSKTIIEEHCNGKLSFENIDNGVLFTIELPDMKMDNE